MNNYLNKLKKEEICALHLRQLYEQYGYKKVNVNKFENFKLYADNFNFLTTDNIITFMNHDGKLLALKPDVTLSIVKNISAESNGISEKFYYIEPVYRMSETSHEFFEVNQMGLEFIGTSCNYQTLEAVNLALLSLREIHKSFLLEISHLGFISGILSGVSDADKPEILKNLHSKNSHDLKAFVSELDINKDYKEKLIALSKLSGKFTDVLERAENLVMNTEMSEAIGELKLIYGFLKETPYLNNVGLDFSIVNDLNYYNGLIFQGFVENIPKMILSGGRYDNLMKKLGKEKGAIGFALSLSELNPYFKSDVTDDCDALIVYDKNSEETDYAALLREIEILRNKGLYVRVENADSTPEFKYKSKYEFKKNTLLEV